MKNEKQKNTNEKKLSRKTIISLVVVVLVFAAVSVVIPLIRLLSSEHGQEIIIEKMQSFWEFALLFVLLQVLQVVWQLFPAVLFPLSARSLSDSGVGCSCRAGFGYSFCGLLSGPVDR
ncbi:MAG: hypothetical protein ACLR5S_00325 [Ruminococcus sp.]